MKRQIFSILIALFLGMGHVAHAQNVFHYTVSADMNAYKIDQFDYNTTSQIISNGSRFLLGIGYERALTQKTSIKLGMAFSTVSKNLVDRLNYNNLDNLGLYIESEWAMQFDWGHRYYFNNPQYLGEGMYGPYIGTNLSYLIMNINFRTIDNIETIGEIPTKATYLRPSFRVGYQLPTFFELDLFAQVNYNLPLNTVELNGIQRNQTRYNEQFNFLNPITFMLGASLIYGW